MKTLNEHGYLVITKETFARMLSDAYSIGGSREPPPIEEIIEDFLLEIEQPCLIDKGLQS